ncbi:hypothetical protein K469DRAFT_582844, partial [Zopfia rhizophila CBS 207.26]
NPNIEKVRQKPKDKDRIHAQKRDEIVKYYEKFKRMVDEKGIHKEDVWNFDETGFRVGRCGNQMVITPGARGKEGKDRKNYTVAAETNLDYLPSAEAISAGTVVILPILVETNQHLFQWYNHTSILGDYIFSVAESGHNNELMLDWI